MTKSTLFGLFPSRNLIDRDIGVNAFRSFRRHRRALTHHARPDSPNSFFGSSVGSRLTVVGWCLHENKIRPPPHRLALTDGHDRYLAGTVPIRTVYRDTPAGTRRASKRFVLVRIHRGPIRSLPRTTAVHVLGARFVPVLAPRTV